jgi:uncharacterized membrane protein YdjX (TVP38/TMEM64 family)
VSGSGRGRVRVVVAVLVVVAVIAAGRLLPVTDWLKAFQAWVAGQGIVGVLAFAAVYVVAALLFVPGSVLTIGAGLTFGLLRGTLVVSAAATTAAALAFLIARHLARPRFEALARERETLRAVDAAVRERGWRVVLLLRLSPVVPFSLSNYLYGVTAVPFLPYVLASWIGMLPGTLLYVSLGAVGAAATGVGGRRTPAEWALLAGGVLATGVAAVLVGRTARRELARTRAR